MDPTRTRQIQHLAAGGLTHAEIAARFDIDEADIDAALAVKVSRGDKRLAKALRATGDVETAAAWAGYGQADVDALRTDARRFNAQRAAQVRGEIELQGELLRIASGRDVRHAEVWFPPVNRDDPDYEPSSEAPEPQIIEWTAPAKVGHRIAAARVLHQWRAAHPRLVPIHAAGETGHGRISPAAQQIAALRAMVGMEAGVDPMEIAEAMRADYENGMVDDDDADDGEDAAG